MARTLAASVRKAGLRERVRFGGEIDDLPAALGLADLVVLPATQPDPSGIMAAAAQAMGKPVIVTNRGALAEAVMPAATGWLVPPDDPGELARALDLALAMDDETRAQPGVPGPRLRRAPSSGWSRCATGRWPCIGS